MVREESRITELGGQEVGNRAVLVNVEVVTPEEGEREFRRSQTTLIVILV